MFWVTSDNSILYDPALSERGFTVLQPKLTLELGKAGSFQFTLPPTNPMYDSISKLSSVIRVYQDGELLFKGRVLNDEADFQNRKKVYCEGDLSYLLDSYMRPYNYDSRSTGTSGTAALREFLQLILTNHNNIVEQSKRMTLGVVTVPDASSYLHLWSAYHAASYDVIKEKLLGTRGGYLRTREVNGVTYLDYLAENTGSTATQTIEFGSNLLDITKLISAEDVFTVLIPLGAQITNEQGETIGRVTIASVNDGKDYLENATGIALYGRIETTHEWDLNTPENLKTRALDYLNSGVVSTKLTIKAVDLSLVTQYAESFRIGDWVEVISDPHGLDAWFQITKIDYDLASPDQTTYEFGTTTATLTEKVIDAAGENVVLSREMTTYINSALESAQQNASNLIHNGIGGYVFLKPDEIYILDSGSGGDIAYATSAWRWNQNGLGYWSGSAGGAATGLYTTAITADGAIVADFITTGTLDAALANIIHLNASNITAGTLSADRIAAGSINGDKITAGTITADRLVVDNLNAISSNLGGWEIDSNYIRKDSVVSAAGDYQYEAWLFAPSSVNSSSRAFGTSYRKYNGGDSYESWVTPFYVTYAGRLVATNAKITGEITATSLNLGSGVSIGAGNVSGLANVATSGSYNDLSGVPNLSIYVAKDGRIGNVPADGVTGFVVSSAGLLQASNAIIYGTIYSSAGLIGGWTISGEGIYTGTWDDTAHRSIGVGLSGQSNNLLLWSTLPSSNSWLRITHEGSITSSNVSTGSITEISSGTVILTTGTFTGSEDFDMLKVTNPAGSLYSTIRPNGCTANQITSTSSWYSRMTPDSFNLYYKSSSSSNYVLRASLGRIGLVFYDSNGNETARYPANP